MSDDVKRDGEVEPDRSNEVGTESPARPAGGSGPDSEGGTDAVESRPGRRRTMLALGMGIAVVALDQLTKWWALSTLQDRGPIELIGSLRLNLQYNTGAAFSVGSGGKIGPFIAVLAAVVVVILLRSPSATASRVGAVSVGLIAGGAAGNLVDRAFRHGPGLFDGAVIDFIDVQWWPVFNIADSALCVGALVFAIVGLREPSHSK